MLYSLLGDSITDMRTPEFKDPYSETIVFDDSEVPTIKGDSPAAEKGISLLPIAVGAIVAYQLFS